MPTAVTNCLKPKFTLVTSSGNVVYINHVRWASYIFSGCQFPIVYMCTKLWKMAGSRQSYCKNNQAYFFGPPCMPNSCKCWVINIPSVADYSKHLQLAKLQACSTLKTKNLLTDDIVFAGDRVLSWTAVRKRRITILCHSTFHQRYDITATWWL